MTTFWESYYAGRMGRLKGSEIRELLKLLDRPNIISFAGGIPDPKFFPTEEISAASKKILSDPKLASQALQYSISEGYLPLRTWIAEQMAAKGVVGVTADHVLITNGSQQGLDFFGKLLIDKGDTVLVAWPTYLGAMQAFNAYEPVYDHLPELGNNRTPESYGVGGHSKPKFGYVMPEFQNPSGTSMSLAERQHMLDVADTMDMPLLEDNAYEKLRYDGAAIPSMLALASQAAGHIDKTKVVYCGTFSKSIAPALRVGWMVGASEVIKKLVLIKQGADLHVSPLTQMIAYEVASSILEPHTAKVREVYKMRRDSMLSALAKHMPQGVSWTKPEGGMFIWLTLPSQVDGAALLKSALEQENIAFVPGAAFFADRSGTNTIRLNFSLNEPSVIAEGIMRLGRLLSAA